MQVFLRKASLLFSSAILTILVAIPSYAAEATGGKEIYIPDWLTGVLIAVFIGLVGLVYANLVKSVNEKYAALLEVLAANNRTVQLEIQNAVAQMGRDTTAIWQAIREDRAHTDGRLEKMATDARADSLRVHGIELSLARNYPNNEQLANMLDMRIEPLQTLLQKLITKS